jgi:alpha-tubulin suppressor-like RCC1 family protein
VTVPTNGSGTGPVRVTVDDQTATGGNFTYLAVIVASFTPASALPGETVTIAGTNFSTAADNNFVLLNGYTAKVETATATQLTVTVPEGEGSGSIRITVDESTGVSTDDFTYLKKVVAWQSLVSGKSSVGLHTCGLRADGTVWCWGSNAFGQFGNGIRSSGANTPQQVGSDSNWVSLTAGSYHTCGLRVDDTAWCWGWNEWGVFGDGTTSLIASTPQWGGGNGNWISLSADTWHTCGIRVGGTAWCWGDDSNGKLGNGTNVRVAIPTPQQVGGNSDWTSLSAGGSHTCGVRANGTAWCWGFNGTGQLGILGQGTTTTPLQVGSDFNWASVSAADDYTCALRTNGTAWCWGWNANGQLGIGTVATIANTPRQVGSASDWLSLSVAKYHTCGVREDGTAWCWGRNVEGQLGNGTNTDANTPQQVSGTADWVSVEVGTSHTCGMRSDSTAWCWGRNVEGQLGNGTNTDSNIPVLVVP